MHLICKVFKKMWVCLLSFHRNYSVKLRTHLVYSHRNCLVSAPALWLPAPRLHRGRKVRSRRLTGLGQAEMGAEPSPGQRVQSVSPARVTAPAEDTRLLQRLKSCIGADTDLTEDSISYGKNQSFYSMELVTRPEGAAANGFFVVNPTTIYRVSGMQGKWENTKTGKWRL